jgi:hypothetical protein
MLTIVTGIAGLGAAHIMMQGQVECATKITSLNLATVFTLTLDSDISEVPSDQLKNVTLKVSRISHWPGSAGFWSFIIPTVHKPHVLQFIVSCMRTGEN